MNLKLNRMDHQEKFRKLEDILEELGDSKKARDLESLAFHLITMPVIEESRE